MAKKYYAVKQGKVPGVYLSWEDCKAQVHGYSGAIYKSFPTAEAAMAFVTGEKGEQEMTLKPDCFGRGDDRKVQGDTAMNSSGSNFDPEDPMAEHLELGEETADDLHKAEQLTAYVDGSYHSSTGEFSYGVVLLENGSEHCFCKKMDDPELAVMRNVAGEIKGAEAAMRYAVDHGYSQITIYHDYEGIARWCTGDWKANKSGTKAYKAYYDSISRQIQVSFRKVKGHSGDKYNDMADRLAKQALGIADRREGQ